MFRHRISKKDNVVGFGAWFNTRTQFHDGYDYTESPKKRISGIMAPGYLTLGPGFDIRANKASLFVSPLAPRLILFTEPSLQLQLPGWG